MDIQSPWHTLAHEVDSATYEHMIKRPHKMHHHNNAYHMAEFIFSLLQDKQKLHVP